MNNKEIEAAVDRVSQLLHQRIGLRPEPALLGRLRRCIRDDAPGRGQDLDTYLDTLLVDGEGLQSLLNRVTVQETAFFRHPEHFELLAREILPTLVPPVTLWSAACANGQEAFSLAMLLEEGGINGRVIATDLSTKALQRTSAARYSSRELSGLSRDRIARHLTRDGDAWIINSNIRARVSSLQHNLLHPVPKQVRACQVIFCRNVLIYFSHDHASAFLDQVADALPAASLFLGAAESMWQLSNRYETVRWGHTFSYRPRADITKPDDQSSHTVELSHNHPRTFRDTGRPAPVHQQTARPRTRIVPRPADTTRFSARPATVPPQPPPVPPSDVASAVALARAGQQASAAGDVQAAVVAFRKYAYLAPHDPMAHLHLGLALESAGDQPSARRAYAVARHALDQTDPADVHHATEGYTTADLIRLLDSKQQAVTP
jgi:chemotaxis methyl-accepting protein methylase